MRLRRRQFLALMGSAAALAPALSLAAAPPGAGMRRLGAIMFYTERDPLGQARAEIVVKTLSGLGWREGENLKIDLRWAGGDRTLFERYAAELVALQPDAILAQGTPAVAALRGQTQTIPVVFVIVSDPVGQGFVQSIARPGGNITGFSDFDSGIAGKWLEMLSQFQPRPAHVGVLYNPTTAPNPEMLLRVTSEAAKPLGMTLTDMPVHDDAEIDAAVTALAREGAAGLLVLPDGFTLLHRDAIIAPAARNRLPAIYWNRYFAVDGGLISFGIDSADLFRRSAQYIDRIFNGEKPGDLPVQSPSKFELVVNLKTAKALGIAVPQSLITAADEVIE